MAASDIEFTTKESGKVRKFLFLKGNTAKERYYGM
jgi:hypothetical protein